MKLSRIEINRRMTVCRHFSGMRMLRAGEKCSAGVEFYTLAKVAELGFTGCALRIPCTGDKVGSVTRGNTVLACEKYETTPESEVLADHEKMEAAIAAITNGLSPCCKLPVSDIAVIKDGDHKGHGPRFCTGCGKLAYQV